jgi:phage terminase large subunit
LKQIQLKPFQDHFLFSQKRYVALIAGIGTGKTYMLLLKIWKFCQDYPNSLALIVRKEFTDLRDSTMKDCERYFGITISSEKDYKFANGSVVMFRHASEIAVLKNINLSIFGIEQAEEFEDESTFTFLRDRLRRDNSPYRQGCLIANACGHNWMYRMWINNPASDDFDISTACTFDNEDNLPADFIADLRRMEIESPNHYKQYVLNSFEELGQDDLLLTGSTVYASPKLSFYDEGTVRRILAVDVARFGEDETVFTIIQSNNIRQWTQIYQHTWREKPLTEVVGKTLDLCREFTPDIVAIDDCGMGGGVTDRLSEQRNAPEAFIGNAKPSNAQYLNMRSEGFFRMKDFFDKGDIKLMNDPVLIDQLLSIRYKYNSNNIKSIVTKDEMRKDGLKSPDRADCLMMALYYTDRVFSNRIRQNLPREALV